VAKKPETNLKERVIPRLKELPNAWVCKIQQVAKVGTPDILMCMSGIFVAIELKSEDGVLAPLQEYNLKKIAECGGIAIIITPHNIDASFLFLETLGKETAKYGIKNPVYQ